MKLFPIIALSGLLLIPITGCEEGNNNEEVITEEPEVPEDLNKREKFYGIYSGHNISKYSHTYSSGDTIITDIKIDTSNTRVEVSEGSIDTLITIKFSEKNVHQIPISEGGDFYSSYFNNFYSYKVNFTLDTLNIEWFSYDGMQANYTYNFFGIKEEDF